MRPEGRKEKRKKGVEPSLPGPQPDVITVIPQPPFKFLFLENEFKLKSLLLNVFKKLVKSLDVITVTSSEVLVPLWGISST